MYLLDELAVLHLCQLLLCTYMLFSFILNTGFDLEKYISVAKGIHMSIGTGTLSRAVICEKLSKYTAGVIVTLYVIFISYY